MNPFEKIIADLKAKEAAGQRISIPPEQLEVGGILLGHHTDDVMAEERHLREQVELTPEEHRASFRGVITKEGRRFWRGIPLLTEEDVKRYLKKGRE